MAFVEDLTSAFGSKVQVDVPLAPLTTLGIGGVADFLLETSSIDELRLALALARRASVRATVVGGGSNVLVSDTGVRGLVLRARHGNVTAIDAQTVRAEAGVTMNGLVRWMIGRGLAGVEAWAGTPGTVGGAVFGNAHFRGLNVSEHVRAVCVLSPEGDLVVVSRDDMAFGYDSSRLQSSGEILLWADFIASPGDPTALRHTARESLAFRKRTQPLHLPSAGCVFQNPPSDTPLPPGVPPSAGALIDLAGLKGLKVGGVRISPVHGNFFVNEGDGTASDFRSLVDRCRRAVRDRFGVVLREEIVYVGEFPPYRDTDREA